MSHDVQLNASCHTFKRAMSLICMCHVYTYERVTSKGWRAESRTWPAHAARHLRRHPPAPHEPLPGLYVHPLHPGARLLAQRCFLERVRVMHLQEWRGVCEERCLYSLPENVASNTEAPGTISPRPVSGRHSSCARRRHGGSKKPSQHSVFCRYTVVRARD